MDKSLSPQTLKPDWQPLGELRFAETGCPLCGQNKGRLRFRKTIRNTTMQYFLCAECDVLYANPHADTDSLKRLYASSDFFEGGKAGSDHLNYHQFVSGENYLRKTARDRLDRILRYQPGGRLLEIACAAGFFLIEARQAGFDVAGIEISKPFAEYAARRWEVPVRPESAEESNFGQDEWNVLASWGVMTILRNTRRFAEKVFQALKPGGVWALNTYYHEGLWPRLIGARWDILTVNMNQIFSRKALCRLVQETGFKLLSMRRERPYTDLEKLADKAIQLSRLRGIGTLVQKTGIARLVIRVPLPDVMEYIWQKQ